MGKRKREIVKLSLESLVSDAVSETESLKEEMESWRDNMDGANMTHLPKYDEVSEACDALEQAESEMQSAQSDFENLPDDVQKTEVDWMTGKRVRSRADRAGDASAKLQTVIDKLRELDEARAKRIAEIEAEEDALDEKKDKAKLEKLQTEREELEERDYESAISSLENAYGELDNVTFPGMY